MGKSEIGKDSPLFQVTSHGVNHYDGAISKDGLVLGSYLHGMFDDKSIREDIIKYLAKKRKIEPPIVSRNISDEWDQSLNLLTSTVKKHLDIEKIFKLSLK